MKETSLGFYIQTKNSKKNKRFFATNAIDLLFIFTIKDKKK